MSIKIVPMTTELFITVRAIRNMTHWAEKHGVDIPIITDDDVYEYLSCDCNDKTTLRIETNHGSIINKAIYEGYMVENNERDLSEYEL